MKKILKISDISALLAGSCAGFVGCSQQAEPTGSYLAKRLKSEDPIEPSEWAAVKAIVSVAQQVQPQAMCYAPPYRDFKELSGNGVVTLHCSKCHKTSVLGYDYAKHPIDYCSTLKDYKRYSRLVGNLNTVSEPLQLKFTLENHEFCHSCGKKDKKCELYLRCEYPLEEQRASAITPLGDVAFPELIGFLQRAVANKKQLMQQSNRKPLDITAEELQQSQQSLDKYQIKLLRKILGL